MADLGELIDRLEAATTEEEFQRLREILEPRVLRSQNASLLGLLATVYRNKKLWQDAERILRQAVRAEPSERTVYQGLALLFFHREDMTWEDVRECARAELETCVEVERLGVERSPITHTLLGKAYESQGNSEQARTEYQTALEIDPHYSEARYNLAVLIRDTDDSADDQVIEMLMQCLEEDSEYFIALRELGWQLIVAERIPEAEFYLTRALALQEDDALLHLDISQLRWTQKDLVGAERHLMRSVELDPTAACYHRFLGNFYRRNDRVEEANGELFFAIELDPNDEENTDKYRAFLEELKDRDLAVGLYQEKRSRSLLPESELRHLDRLLGFGE